MQGNTRRAFLILVAAILVLAVTATAVAQTVAPTPTPQAPLTPATEEVEEVEEEEQGLAVAVQPGSLELTVYNQNLGLVSEVRTIALVAGINEVRFTDVASQIRPTTVHVVSLTAPAQTILLEQNYEYDLVSSSKLLQRYIDQPIRLTTSEGQIYTGTLLSGYDDVILATEEGISVVRASQILEFSFPALPEGLITRPTLVWLVQAAEAGEQDLQVTYLTGGISWQADYIAMLNAADDELSLTGWISLDNNSGATYNNAKLKLVAGDISQVTVEKEYAMEDMLVRALATPAPQVAERSFFEYHLYDVARPVTVRDRQTKQIEFVQAPEVTVAKEYVFQFTSPIYVGLGSAITDRFWGGDAPVNAEVRIQLINDEENGLGMPLPQGAVRVYKEDIDGGAQLVGEAGIGHTPRNEAINLTLGRAFDIVGERSQTAFRQLGERQMEETIEIVLRNQKDEAVTVRLIEHLYRAQDAQVLESSEDYTQVDANTIAYEVEIGAEDAVTITYTVMYRW
jgi:hypothetical protein